MKSEVESFFDRIDYELKIFCMKGETADKKKVIRWLRKERDDLVSYVKQQSKIQPLGQTREEQELSAQKILKEIEEKFKVLLIRYKEVQNG